MALSNLLNMVRRRTTVPKKKETKVEPKDRICLKCIYAYLMQNSKTNPIVSECTKTKERFVASTPHCENCSFQENKEEPIIHKMILLK